ncbi:hypothetical protein OSB04_010169 [Centaurea solstitialis]|uniref:Cytochrome P450 n=1 Tax=Centaurea solstitialis TaxID=347529 RepID=A0AA38T706_9ASTR|nr:hypothetical protein OSB04_010169 [Centaurea solstitialis]
MLVSKVIEIAGKPNLSDFFPTLARFDLQGVEREMKREVKRLDGMLSEIIDDRIKSNLKNNLEGAVIGDVVKKDALQKLLEFKDQKDASSLSITQVKTILMDIMIAGTETSTTLIEWAMAEIMKNDNVMKRIQEELTEIVGLNNIVEESHLPKLKYLDATIKESLRLHPVAPLLLPRSPTQACIVGGYTIPKGCTVFLNVWTIHRDPNTGTIPWNSTPIGRRLCPGIPLAVKMQMYILASLLHLFEWSLPKGEEHDLTDKFGVTLKKRKPLIAVPSQRLPNASLYM